MKHYLAKVSFFATFRTSSAKNTDWTDSYIQNNRLCVMKMEIFAFLFRSGDRHSIYIFAFSSLEFFWHSSHFTWKGKQHMLKKCKAQFSAVYKKGWKINWLLGNKVPLICDVPPSFFANPSHYRHVTQTLPPVTYLFGQFLNVCCIFSGETAKDFLMGPMPFLNLIT